MRVSAKRKCVQGNDVVTVHRYNTRKYIMKQIELSNKEIFTSLMDVCADVDAPIKVCDDDYNSFVIMNTRVYIKMRTKLFEEAMMASSHEDTATQSGYDPLIPQIILKGIECGGVDTEIIQKTFHIGYARTVRIISQLEDLRYVSYDSGEKYKVLLSYEDFLKNYKAIIKS